jgi:type IV secretion system protein VirB8
MTDADTSAENRAPMDYYAQGQAWAHDREAASLRSRRIAWIIAGVAVGVAALEAVAIAMMAPLKTVEQHMVLVDRQTGFTQVLNGEGMETISADEAFTQSMLAQYVIARESYDVSTVANDYRKVALWSADRARSNYVSAMQSSNPASPIASLPRSTTIATHILSVSKLGAETALVRFETQRFDRGQSSAPAQSWAAVVHYRYVSSPMSLDDRLINPLGFQVTRYRRDQEAPPQYVKGEPSSSAENLLDQQPSDGAFGAQDTTSDEAAL